jgi:hypothetical protein
VLCLAYTGVTAAQELPARPARLELARTLSTQVRVLSDRLPIPRPSDSAWVDAEQAARKPLDASASASRSLQMYETPEFQHVALYNHLREIHSGLDCVTQQGVQLRREVFCWGVVSYLLGDHIRLNDGVRILHRAGRLPTDITSQAKVGSLDGFALFWGIQSRQIQESILLPYLRSDLK